MDSIALLLAAFSFFVSFGNSVLPTHLFAEGLSPAQILLGSLILIAGQALFVAFLAVRARPYSARKAWIVGIVLYAAFFALSCLRVASPLQYYIGTLLAGIGSTVFYLFYNFVFFSGQEKDRSYTRSAKFFNISLAVSIIVPLVSGAAGSLGFGFVLALSGVFALVALFAVSRQEEARFSVSLRESLRALGRARSIVLLAGLLDSVSWGVISVITLSFIKSPLHFGGFLSYLALVSLVSNVLISRFGEKRRKGHAVAAVSAVVVAVALLAVGFSTGSLAAWTIANGFYQLVLPIFESAVLGLTLERSGDRIAALPAREMLLAAGRLIGLAVACALFFSGSAPWLIFALPAAAALLLGVVAGRGHRT